MSRRSIDLREQRSLGCRLCVICFVAVFGLRFAIAQEANPVPPASALPAEGGFDVVAEIFASRCITCHNINTAKGGLSLQSRQSALTGGESGTVIELGEPEESLLLDYVHGPEPNMPPEGDPLTERQVTAIEFWIAQGSPWPEDRELTENHLDDRSWWSFQPLKQVDVPQVAFKESSLKQWPRNEMDHFVLDRLLAEDLRPAPEADRRTLIRRLYFDLIGLPPTRDAIEAFLNDERPDAYERLVEELLESERYGERWARYWLDIVHYGDTHGYDKDKLRPNAWPYRDYVIRSLNADKPWSRFVREQIAGDVLYPETRDGIEALGFISAGPWDFVGHAEVSEEKIDGQIARHLDRDDMVRTTLQSFMGLTVGCAQCHDHKFDPIAQMDYYSLQAVFAALDRADKTYDLNPQTSERRRSLTLAIAEGKRENESLRQVAVKRVASELRKLDAVLGEAKEQSSGGPSKAFGFHSGIESKQELAKWVQIDLGKPISVDRIVLHPCKDDFNGIGEGFGFPLRFQVQLSNEADFRSVDSVITVADETEQDFPNPKLKPVAYRIDHKLARYLRITATKLAPRKNDFIFALAEVEVYGNDDLNHATEARVSSLDSIEAGPRWQRSNLTDGLYPGQSDRIKTLQKKREQIVKDAMTADEQARSQKLRLAVLADEQQLATLPTPSTVYAGTVLAGKGKFKGTGGNGGKPRPIFLLERGEVTRPRGPATPGALSVLGMDHHFALKRTHGESDRRAALANWLTDSQNPLTWRNIVNRVWQYHFGRGIVETPNDFGKMGGVPSHPALLDYLAVSFRDRGQSLKQLHRMIVTSATWRQSSQPHRSIAQQALAVDVDNRLLWKMPRRKLEAEAVRDSVLFVSGRLDLSMYGPGYRDFVLKNPQHSPHYEYHLHDPEDPATHRRSIYRFIVRSQLQPFMSTLDCADPSILVGRRTESLTPLQSLTMLNSGLIVTMGNHFASRLEQQYEKRSEQIHHGFAQAIGRPPTESELALILGVAQKHGLPNACRLIFNLNEFSFVD